MEKRLKPRLDAVRALMVKNESSKTAQSYLHMTGGISSRSGGQARSIKHKRLVDLAAFD